MMIHFALGIARTPLFEVLVRRVFTLLVRRVFTLLVRRVFTLLVRRVFALGVFALLARRDRAIYAGQLAPRQPTWEYVDFGSWSGVGNVRHRFAMGGRGQGEAR